MALSESGLAAQGVSPGPMVIGTGRGRRLTVRVKHHGPAKGSQRVRFQPSRSYYVPPRKSR